MGKTNDERIFLYCLLIVMVIAANRRGVPYTAQTLVSGK